jgi:hypothetical protein
VLSSGLWLWLGIGIGLVVQLGVNFIVWDNIRVR